MAYRRGDWTIWLSRFLFNPWCRAALAAVAVGATVTYFLVDRAARSAGVQSPVARDGDDLLLAIWLGAMLGVAGSVVERHQLTRHRARSLAFHHSPAPERLEWKHQRSNVLETGWFLLALYALMGWCLWAEVLVYPAFFAAVAPVVINIRLASDFGKELRESLHGSPSDQR